MAEQDRPAVGTVAQEAARLLDALGEWAHSTTDHGTEEHGREGDRSQDRGSSATAGPGRRCEHCGSETGMGRAVACQLCPVCQGIGLLRSVRPETVDRLADLAAAVTTALRDLAASQRGAPGENGTRDHGPARKAATPVQDITIEDEESGTP